MDIVHLQRRIQLGTTEVEEVSSVRALGPRMCIKELVLHHKFIGLLSDYWKFVLLGYILTYGDNVDEKDHHILTPIG